MAELESANAGKGQELRREKDENGQTDSGYTAGFVKQPVKEKPE